MIDGDDVGIDNEQKNKLIESWGNKNAVIAGSFVLVILVVFPLVFRNFYSDILKVKYWFYCGMVFLLIAAMLINLIVFIYKDKNEYEGRCVKRILHLLSWKSIRASEWCMIAFVSVAVISTFQSRYFYESFWGNEGRYSGLFLILLYGISFLIIARCLRFQQWYLDLFLLTGLLVGVLGILNYFKYDPIGFKSGLSWADYRIFLSTIGNINTYTAYLALPMGVSMLLFCYEQRTNRKIWYFIVMVVLLLAMVTGISDNAYLTLLALFGFMPLYLFVSLKGIKQYIVILSVFFTEIWIVGVLNRKFPSHVIGIEGIFEVIAGFKWLPLVIIILWGIAIILYIVHAVRIKRKTDKDYSKLGRWIWLGVIVAVILMIGYILVDVNAFHNIEKYGTAAGYLLFNDKWGSGRGYIWRIGMELYNNFPIFHKLFGSGPDTFGILTVTDSSYFKEMVTEYYQRFDSPHNEFLQYLITMGIMGAASYVCLLVVSIIEMVRNMKKHPAVIAIVFSIIGYSAQSLVNINVPIVTPIMFTLLAVGVSVDKIR